MSNLNEYLGQKREAVLLRNARDPQTVEPVKLRAQVSAEGRSGCAASASATIRW